MTGGSPHGPKRNPVGSRFDAILARVLPARFHRLIRFAIAGMTATIAYFVITNGLVLVAGLDPVAASVIAYLLSLWLSYLLQSSFTFRATPKAGSQAARFALTGLAGLAISYVVMLVVSDHFGWSYFVGATSICVLIPAANYLVFRTWVFRAGRREPREQAR